MDFVSLGPRAIKEDLKGSENVVLDGMRRDMSESEEKEQQGVDLVALPRSLRTIVRTYGTGFLITQEDGGKWTEIWITRHQAELIDRALRNALEKPQKAGANA